jgi:NitT/TauT family transport system substrate-binding protein
LRLAVPDLISNSYFPVIAAVELGCFAAEGLEVTHELIFPVDKAYEALRDGMIDFVGGSSHSALAAFPEWRGVDLLCAQGQGMYWFLVMRADLGAQRGDLSVLRGKRIGAAPWVDMGLRRLLIAAGLDPAKEAIAIAPVPGAQGAGVNFGLTAARALAEGKIDGFWANGMGAEVAVTGGAGTILLDVRRGDGPKACFDYTMSALAARSDLPREHAVAAVRAVMRAQALLKENPERATGIGGRLFPPEQAALIADLIRRDLPYYTPEISEGFVQGMNRFARDLGILAGDPRYEEVVRTDVVEEWRPIP